MSTYTIYVEETVSRSFDVEASSAEEAEEIGKKIYQHDRETVRDEEVTYRQIMVSGYDDSGRPDETEWSEL